MPPICLLLILYVKKKKIEPSWVVRGFGGWVLLFPFFTLAPGRDSGSEDGGSFWNVTLGLLKKKRCAASDKFLTILKLIMSGSGPLPWEPFFLLLSSLSAILSFPLCFFMTSIQTWTPLGVVKNCEVHVHPNVPKNRSHPTCLRNCCFSSDTWDSTGCTSSSCLRWSRGGNVLKGKPCARLLLY